MLLAAAAPRIPENADLFALNRPPAYTFLDVNGTIAGRRGAFVGDRLSLNQLPHYLPAAFLAMEDRRFYEHHGLDAYGILRALKEDVIAGHIVQGGSTITQQIVKTLFLTPDRTISRKIPEIAGALALERRLSKNQILELYLNRIYLGSGAYGVDGAARVYFGKSAREVTLSEAAMLAAMTRSPSAFSPRRDLAMAQMRAGQVLDAMVSSGAITRAQAAEAKQHPATVADRSAEFASDYFFDVAAEEAQKLTGGARGDLVVATTFDPRMQEQARATVSDVLDRRGKASRAGQVALVAMTPDGAIRAIVGGRDYADSSFNRATMAKRQPGSAFKPFVYLTALEQGLSPWTVRNASPSGEYAPKNFHDEQYGDVTLDQALANSINTVAVNIESEVGAKAVVAVAHRLGIGSPLSPYASLALGTSEVSLMELTGAYASFASAGFRATPHTVLEVRNGAGAVLYRYQPIPPERVIDEDKALTMNAMLYDVVSYGTGRAAAVPGREVAGKTGTSADFHDAWFIGYSSTLVTGVWVGNDDSSPMKNITGGTLPAQIWSGFMRQALAATPASPLPRAFPAPAMETEAVAAVDDAGTMSEEQQQDASGDAGPTPTETATQPTPHENATRETQPLPFPRELPPPQSPPEMPWIREIPPAPEPGVRDLEQDRENLARQERAQRQHPRTTGRDNNPPYPDEDDDMGGRGRIPYPDREAPRENRGYMRWPDSDSPPRLVMRPDGSWEAVQ